MEFTNENNLSISESQDVNELNAEELDAVTGGGLIGGLVGAVGGFTASYLSGDSMSDSIQAAAALGTLGAVLPVP